MARAFDDRSNERIIRSVLRTEGTKLPVARSSDCARPSDPGLLLAKPAADIAKGSTGTVKIYRGPVKGSETYTPGDDAQVFARAVKLKAVNFCYIQLVNGGWEGVPVGCT